MLPGVMGKSLSMRSTKQEIRNQGNESRNTGISTTRRRRISAREKLLALGLTKQEIHGDQDIEIRNTGILTSRRRRTSARENLLSIGENLLSIGSAKQEVHGDQDNGSRNTGILTTRTRRTSAREKLFRQISRALVPKKQFLSPRHTNYAHIEHE